MGEISAELQSIAESLKRLADVAESFHKSHFNRFPPMEREGTASDKSSPEGSDPSVSDSSGYDHDLAVDLLVASVVGKIIQEMVSNNDSRD